MAKINIETKNKLQFLIENFTEEDYNNYIDGNIEYRELCNKFNCSDYIMSTFFKEKNL